MALVGKFVAATFAVLGVCFLAERFPIWIGWEVLIAFLVGSAVFKSIK